MTPFNGTEQHPVATSARRTAWRAFYRPAAGALAVALLLPGCLIDRIYGDLPNAIEMTPKVIALDGLNSPYDDFNAVAAPPPLKMDGSITCLSHPSI